MTLVHLAAAADTADKTGMSDTAKAWFFIIMAVLVFIGFAGKSKK